MSADFSPKSALANCNPTPDDLKAYGKRRCADAPRLDAESMAELGDFRVVGRASSSTFCAIRLLCLITLILGLKKRFHSLI